MGILNIAKDIVGGIIEPVGGIIDDLHTSDEEKSEARAKLAAVENEFRIKVLDSLSRVTESQAKVLVSEAQGDSWLQRNWRPLTMLTFVFIIANNYVIAPYVSAFGGEIPTLEIVPGMWALLNVGIGGYIASRGVEKVFKIRNGK